MKRAQKCLQPGVFSFESPPYCQGHDSSFRTPPPLRRDGAARAELAAAALVPIAAKEEGSGPHTQAKEALRSQRLPQRLRQTSTCLKWSGPGYQIAPTLLQLACGLRCRRPVPSIDFQAHHSQDAIAPLQACARQAIDEHDHALTLLQDAPARLTRLEHILSGITDDLMREVETHS